MKIIYLVYTDLHVNISKSLSLFLPIKTLGPIDIISDYKLSKYKFDIRSFLPIYFFLSKKKMTTIINNYDYIGISCLNFTFNNIIFSNHNSQNVFITYDGLINLQPVEIPFKEKAKDIAKYILFSFRGIKYTIRKKTFSGIDILKCRSGFVDISKHILPIHFFINTNHRKIIKNDMILYISIANDAININKYLLYEKTVLQFITNYFNKPIKIIYKSGINSNYINNELAFNRTEHNHLIAEEIIYINNSKSYLYNSWEKQITLPIYNFNNYYNIIENVHQCWLLFLVDFFKMSKNK